MDCERVRELLLLGETTTREDLSAHLETCTVCADVAARAAWLDRLLRPELLVAAPPEAASQALRAALLAALPAQPPAGVRPAAGPFTPRSRGTRGPTLAAYLLAGAALALAASLLATGPLGSIDMLVGPALDALWLVLRSPAVWLVPSPERLVADWTTWTALLVLAWGLRTTLASSSVSGARSESVSSK
jgi:hypothetical protein